MFLQKITTFLLILSLSFAVSGGLIVQAQTQTSTTEADTFATNICPIDGFVSATLINDREEYQVDGQFSENIILFNDSNYTFAGVRVGVAVYKNKTDVVPTYWTVLPETYQLSAKEDLEVPVELDLSHVAAGEYLLKLYTIQGDETALLGEVIRGVKEVEGVILTKSSIKMQDTSVTVTLNRQVQNGGILKLAADEPMLIEVKTENKGSLPLINSKMLAVVTQGSVPIGVAVLAETLDSVKLIPGSSRLTKIENNLIIGSDFTVYAALVTEGSFQPVVAVPVQVGDENFGGSWAYISKLGLAEKTEEKPSEVVACIQYVGDNKNSEVFLEPLAVDFNLANASQVLATERIISLDTGTRNYFSYSPATDLEDFTLTTNLLHQRFSVAYNPDTDKRTREEIVRDGFSKVDTLALEFTCDNPDMCRGEVEVLPINNDTQSSDNSKSFWFFAGIVIAAALLGYLMLRRLDPQDDGAPTKTTPDELQ